MSSIQIPDSGYLIAIHRGPYLAVFNTRADALLAAGTMAERIKESVDIIKVQGRGNERFVIDEVFPRSWKIGLLE